MKDIIYRPLDKSDYKQVEELIANAFGLRSYVEDEKTFEKIKKMYLASCLSEQKFSTVAINKGKIVGIIMGASKNDKYKLSNISNVIKLIYYTFLILITNKNKGGLYNQVHMAYGELIKGIEKDFNGVLTLFIVKDGMRGLGIGKELLSRLNEYFVKYNTDNFYLYTDDTCNYGFYEHMGFNRLREKQVNILRDYKNSKMDVYLYNFNMSVL